MKGVLLAPILAVALSSCGPPAPDGGFDSANPAAKMYAIEYAARDGDRTAIGRIVEQLDSDDPGVRFLAIAALRKLTNQTYGYCDYDPPELRRAAIERWRTALESGEIKVNDSTNESATDPAPAPAHSPPTKRVADG